MKKTFVAIMVMCAIMCTGCGNTTNHTEQIMETRELTWYEQDIMKKKEEISNKYGEGHWEDPDSVDEVQTFIVVSPSKRIEYEYDYDLKSGLILTTRFTGEATRLSFFFSQTKRPLATFSILLIEGEAKG